MKIAHLKTLACLFALFVLQGCALGYSANSIRARVVDAETKQPLKGVNVIAMWTLTHTNHFALHGGHSYYALEVAEAVTDEDGWFRLPAWGPMSIPAEVPATAALPDSAPLLGLFKSGYRYNTVSNHSELPLHSRAAGSRRVSDWDGKTIEMSRHVGDRALYANLLPLPGRGYGHLKCAYKKTPLLHIALEREARELDKEGVNHRIRRLRDLEEESVSDNCGSVKAFFAPYLKSGDFQE